MHSDCLKKHESKKHGSALKLSRAICESHHAVVFETKVSHFRVKYTPLKDKNGIGKVK